MSDLQFIIMGNVKQIIGSFKYHFIVWSIYKKVLHVLYSMAWKGNLQILKVFWPLHIVTDYWTSINLLNTAHYASVSIKFKLTRWYSNNLNKLKWRKKLWGLWLMMQQVKHIDRWGLRLIWFFLLHIKYFEFEYWNIFWYVMFYLVRCMLLINRYLLSVNMY